MGSNLIIGLATAVILACAVVGLYLLTISNRMYYARTRDPHFWTRFWLHKSLLSRQEYVLNRWGFWIVRFFLSLSLGSQPNMRLKLRRRGAGLRRGRSAFI
jgi:hypothetical protein